MNEVSKHRLTQAKDNLRLFDFLDIRAAAITGSVAKGYADDNSDIDTIVMLNNPMTQGEFDKIVEDAKASGGDFYHGSPEEGFAVYSYVDGVRCDFGFGHYSETETLINEMLEKPEVDLTKHLMISGLIDGYILKDSNWLAPLIKKAEDNYPQELQVMLVSHFKKFHPEWAIEKMTIGRGDILYYYESLVEMTGNIIGILCGLNKFYHPGKLKGVEHTITKMHIKPHDFVKRYNFVLSAEKYEAIKEMFSLVRETFDLIDVHLPEVITKRSREVLEMVLRK
ncbi:MAG TPA: nucleotidyltransferase domain-containing protein [Ignavibacteria bacterium]|nr:nucleotidyltransferase domain-containing protein [Ignavibacteria bacterium]HMQ97831.1 nucleotidyltransferase domain-containing protein [Ignavibacteria bacterium]